MKTKAYLWTAAALAWAANVAMAADDGFEAPPLEAGLDWISIAIAVVGVLGLAAAAFKNPKRTHLD